MKPVSSGHWKLRKKISSSAEMIAKLAGELSIHQLTAQVLLQRGIFTPSAGREFLDTKLSSLPNPDLLPDMKKACCRLVQAIKTGEKISVHGDYDVDGISGCALLIETLHLFGAEVTYHIPLRLKDGYGLSVDAINKAKKQGCGLLVSVDCGVSAIEEAEIAAEIGLDLIITDHHQPAEQLPRCLALINPYLSTNRFPWKDLSGVGVAFFLLIGLRRHLREENYFTNYPEPDLRQGLDLVALGTIADIVPLVGVNRILVHNGLKLLDKGIRPGVIALKRVADVKTVTSGVVGFHLAPRLNAAGRLEDASLGVQLLLEKNIQKSNALAELLDGFNSERQKIEQQTLAEAIAMLEDDQGQDRFSIVLASDKWHSGVIGIVASRLVERYHCPTVLIAMEDKLIGKGSARSVNGFHLYQALSECSDVLLSYGGHAMAAGLSITRENLADFRTAFDCSVRNKISEDDLLPMLLHDGEILLEQLSIPLLNELDMLNPFGAGNPQPVFVSRNCHAVNPRGLAEKHLKFSVEQKGYRIDCIAFGFAERLTELKGEIDLLFRPDINRWQGKESLQLQVIDFRKATV